MQDQPSENKNQAAAPGLGAKGAEGDPKPQMLNQGTTPAPKSSPDDRSTTFRPVEGGTQMQSGEKLLVEAYAAIWIIAMLFLVSIFRRQKRIDARMASLETALEKSRDRSGTK